MEARLGTLVWALSATLGPAACAADAATNGDAGARIGTKAPVHRTAGDAASGDSAESGAGNVTPRYFSGEVEGSDARIGMVVGATRARLYFCGGDSTYRTRSRWLPGNVAQSGEFVADPATAMDWLVRATVTGDAVTGSLSMSDAETQTFHGSVVENDTIAGLYEATAPCGKVGLIVSQASPSDSPSGQGACVGTGPDVSVRQVNPVLPLTRNADGAIGVVVAGTTEPLTVTAAAPPAD